MEAVTISLGKVEVIKNYWSDKATKSSELPSKESEGVKKLIDELPLLTKLKELNSSLTSIEDWSGVMQLLQTELSDSKQRVDQLESELSDHKRKVDQLESELSDSKKKIDQLESELSGSKEKTKSQLTNLQEHNTRLEIQLQSVQENKVNVNQLKNELSEMSSQLLIKEKELIKFKEDNKLLAKQFRGRKQKKIREATSQDQLIQHELLGSGRYGEVYKISYSGKLYAGKVIYKKLLPGHPDPSVDQINKLMEEIENASAMLVTNQHPNIEQFHSVVQLNPASPPILLSELSYENLNNYIARMKGSLPIYAQLDLCLDMAKGLQFLHTAGLVHNNLHGTNVLISQDGLAKIADYICPLVGTLNKQTTLQNNVYMSPELIKNMTIYSKQSDIYSLGVLCLQVATQSPPMPKYSADLSEIQRWKEQLDQITTNPLFPLIIQCLGITLARPSIDRICAKLMAAKETPQSIISDSLQCIKDTSEFGAALQSGRYKMKWTKCANLPTPMRNAHATVINDILYVGGGLCTIGNDHYYIFSYKLTDDQWRRLPFLPYCYGVPTNINNKISYIGGYDPFTSSSTNEVITLENSKWITQYPNMIVARQLHAAIMCQHYIIVAGGMGKDLSTLDTIEVFNCSNYEWSILSTRLPKPMKVINATTCNQSIIIAGYDIDENHSSNSAFIISIDTLTEEKDSLTSSTSEVNNKWSEIFHTPYWNATIIPKTFPPVVVGGQNVQGKVVDNIFLYDDSSDSWRTISSLPIKCAGATVAAINNVIIIAGGVTDYNNSEAINAISLTSVVSGKLQLCN